MLSSILYFHFLLCISHTCDRINDHQAEAHFVIGLRDASKLLSQIDASNCGALCVSSILVCFYTWAKGHSPGDLLCFSDWGPAAWWPLLRGVRSIIEAFGPEVVHSGLLEPLKSGPTHTTESTIERKQLPRVDQEEPMRELRQFIVSSSLDQHLEIYLRALDDLLPCFEATYGKSDGTYDGGTEHQVIFRWLYRIEESSILCLQRKELIALLILARFALLMKTLEDSRWFMEGWVKHIMIGIHAFLDDPYLVWLRWPMEQAGLITNSEQENT